MVAVGLEYTGPTPQPLFVMGRSDGIGAVLRDVIRPRAAYIAARPEMLPAIEPHYRVDAGPQMVRMWVDRAHFRPYPATVQRLLPVEIGELNRLYQLGFASWLPSTAIADGVYYGMRVNGRLIAAAGTHVVSPGRAARGRRQRADPHDYRGRGFATAVTGAVTAELLRTLRPGRAQRPRRQPAGDQRLPPARLQPSTPASRSGSSIDSARRGPTSRRRCAASSSARRPTAHDHRPRPCPPTT